MSGSKLNCNAVGVALCLPTMSLASSSNAGAPSQEDEEVPALPETREVWLPRDLVAAVEAADPKKRLAQPCLWFKRGHCNRGKKCRLSQLGQPSSIEIRNSLS